MSVNERGMSTNLFLLSLEEGEVPEGKDGKGQRDDPCAHSSYLDVST
jgi:hypothetical protein